METDTLKKLQKIELEILLEIDRICKKHNITYMLSSGTLLGAIRHKGFIPWDDDIDIIMPFQDYLRFCNVCKSDLDGKYFFQNFKTDHFSHFYAKVRKNGTTMIEHGSPEGIHHGIWVDIFPIVGTESSEEWLRKANAKLGRIKKFLRKINATGKWKTMSLEKKIIRLLPRRFLLQIIVFLLKHFLYSPSECGSCCYLWGGEYLENRFPSELFTESSEVEFEGYSLPAPKKYENYLTIVYGDYMTLPPPEQRNGGSHTVIKVDFGEKKEDKNG